MSVTEPLEAPGGAVPAVTRPAPAERSSALYGAEGAVPHQDGERDWRRYLAAVTRYKWVVLLVTVAGALLGVLATRFVQPEYQAQATIWIESPNVRGEDRGPIRADQLLQASSWLQLLKTFLVLEDVVRDQRLYVTPKAPGDSGLFAAFKVASQFRPGVYRLAAESGGVFTLSTAAGARVQRGSLGDSIGSVVGFRWAPPANGLRPGRVVDFTVATPRSAAEQLARRLRAKTDEAGNFLSIQLTGTDPAGTAAVLNAILQRYVAVAADLKRDKLSELSKILAEQLQYAERNLKNAEEALEGFRVHTITLPADRATPVTPGLEFTRDPVFSGFFNMKVEREQLRRDGEAIEQALVHAPAAGLSVDALTVIGAVQQSPELVQALKELTDKQAERRALRYRYTADHPQVLHVGAQVDTLERVTIPRLARTLVHELAAREGVVSARVQSASEDLRQIPPRAIQEGRLRREVTIAENLFTTLQQRYEEARLAEASSIPDVRVLDEAAPPLRPLRNTAPGVILGALVGSLGLSLLGVVLLDRADPRVRYPRQVTEGLGLTIVGAVPRVRNGDSQHESAGQVIESLRGIRLSLIHVHGTAGPLLVTITSPGIGEGKSFVSANLALAYAESGQQTLLIDGDVRRGGLHRVLGHPRKPGLTDFLAGRVPLETVIRPTSYSNLHLISAGTRFHDAPELLGSPAMIELITRVRASYRVILVDSPPLGSGVDPFTLGTLTGSLLLVLRTGTTNLELARIKLALLDHLPIRLLGVVLNDVLPGGVYRYYNYLAGYGTEDEEVAVPGRRLRGAL